MTATHPRRQGRQDSMLVLCLLAGMAPCSRSGFADQPAAAAPAIPICIGHLTPDSDSIASAIAAARLYGGIAARAGPMNPESIYLLQKFHFTPPVLIEDFVGRPVIILDHNQTTQAHPTMCHAQIQAIVDHHALRSSPYVTDQPTRVDIRPLGSTCTILAQDFNSRNIPLDKPLAGLLLGGILSDTLILTSPTTTDQDRLMAELLARSAGITDLGEFGRELIEKKSDLSTFSDQEVLLLDFKRYDLAGHAVGFGVAETVSPEFILKREDGILKEMLKIKKDQKLDHIFFAVVDILASQSTMLTLEGDDRAVVDAIYPGKSRGSRRVVPGFVSRKKQFLPLLQNYLETFMTQETSR